MLTDAPSRILAKSAELRRGIAVAVAEPGLFRDLYRLLWAMPALCPTAQRELVQCVGTGDPAGACAVLMRRGSFRRKAA